MPAFLNDSTVSFFLVALTSIFFLVDPLTTVPVFLVLTSDHGPRPRRRMARRAAVSCFVVLSGFSLAGQLLFKLFGITLPAFQIAGGIILLLIGLDMVQVRRSRTKQVEGEADEATHRDDIGIVPLGVPMLAGPGAISTVMLFMGQARGWPQMLAVLLAIALTSLAAYVTLSTAGLVRKHLGDTGINILTRIMGMLLAAIAIQFIATGVLALAGASSHLQPPQ